MFADRVDYRFRGKEVVYRIYNTEMDAYRTEELTKQELILVLLHDYLQEVTDECNALESLGPDTIEGEPVMEFRGQAFKGRDGNRGVDKEGWCSENPGTGEFKEQWLECKANTLPQAREQVENRLVAALEGVKKLCAIAGIDFPGDLR